MATAALQPHSYRSSIQLDYTESEPVAFPLALSPSSDNPQLDLDDIVSEIHRVKRSGELDTLLDKHGAIYFQNLKLKNADHFSQFAHAFGWVPHEDIGNPVRRTVHAKNVASANEGPNTQPVYPHNEFGLSPHYPSYVFFYCVSAPETGTYPRKSSLFRAVNMVQKWLNSFCAQEAKHPSTILSCSMIG